RQDRQAFGSVWSRSCRARTAQRRQYGRCAGRADRPEDGRIGASGGGLHGAKRNRRRSEEELNLPSRRICGSEMTDGVSPLGPTFLSYRASDGRIHAEDLAWALRAAGVPVWHDETDLPPGDTRQRLQEALGSGLAGAVLVVTPELVHSSIVRDLEVPHLRA